MSIHPLLPSPSSKLRNPPSPSSFIIPPSPLPPAPSIDHHHHSNSHPPPPPESADPSNRSSFNDPFRDHRNIIDDPFIHPHPIQLPIDQIPQSTTTLERPSSGMMRNSMLIRREDNFSIRCILIDRLGRILGSRSMSKSEICAQNRLQPRDLRKIDSRISNVVPSILVRDEAIIFNVLNIRALIKADSIVIFEDPNSSSMIITHPPPHPNHPSRNPSPPPSSSSSGSEKSTKAHPSTEFSIRSAFLHNLLNNLRDQPSPSPASSQNHPNHRGSEVHPPQQAPAELLPYEFRALETMLGSVAASLESELGVLKTLVSNLLDGLEQNIEREKLKQLLLYSRRLSIFNARALLVQRCLDEILENEQDMADAYLSQKKNLVRGEARQVEDHEELEQLLESFSKYVEEIVHEGTSTLTNIKSTEEIIDLILDSNRNTLLALDLKVSIATMGLAIGAFTAGLFGMNLRSHFEDDRYAFYVVSGLTITTVGLSIAYGCRRLYRLRRVGLSSLMSSSHHHHPNPSSTTTTTTSSRKVRYNYRSPPTPPTGPRYSAASATATTTGGSGGGNGGILDWDVPPARNPTGLVSRIKARLRIGIRTP